MNCYYYEIEFRSWKSSNRLRAKEYTVEIKVWLYILYMRWFEICKGHTLWEVHIDIDTPLKNFHKNINSMTVKCFIDFFHEYHYIEDTQSPQWLSTKHKTARLPYTNSHGAKHETEYDIPTLKEMKK